MSRRDDRAQAEDPEQYNQRRRLEAIADARRDALTIHQRLPAEGGVPGDPLSMVQMFTAAQAYVLELEQLIRKHGDPKYYSHTLGELNFSPPEKFDVTIKRRGKGRIHRETETIETKELQGHAYPRPVDEYPENERQEIVGLISRLESDRAAFADLPPNPGTSWEFQVRMSESSLGIAKGHNSSPVPWHISVQAIKLANQFVSEFGLDVEEGEVDEDSEVF